MLDDFDCASGWPDILTSKNTMGLDASEHDTAVAINSAQCANCLPMYDWLAHTMAGFGLGPRNGVLIGTRSTRFVTVSVPV